MRILGIDPALAVTGYGAIESNKNGVFLQEAGVIKTSAKDSMPVRLEKIFQAVDGLLLETKPQVVVLEKIYSHYGHPTTSYILGHARGVISLACAKRKIEVAEYAATRVKKAIVGKGLASKGQIQRMIQSIFNIKELPRYNDVTDALALAVAHSYIMKAKI
ncbi:MAG: crossover junction endodeoxyribonuclease RuvC [Candidatus Omnitrophica bacterium]|nr:crossover junction endodeoxyribonuclease RuvC [Candidatus Omnitrophota bacterium]